MNLTGVYLDPGCASQQVGDTPPCPATHLPAPPHRSLPVATRPFKPVCVPLSYSGNQGVMAIRTGNSYKNCLVMGSPTPSEGTVRKVQPGTPQPPVRKPGLCFDCSTACDFAEPVGLSCGAHGEGWLAGTCWWRNRLTPRSSKPIYSSTPAK
jgi:hypothetical protein